MSELRLRPYENALLSIIGGGTAKVNSGTVITTHGDISVSGKLSVDGGMILTNGDIIKDGSAADVSKKNLAQLFLRLCESVFVYNINRRSRPVRAVYLSAFGSRTFFAF